MTAMFPRQALRLLFLILILKDRALLDLAFRKLDHQKNTKRTAAIRSAGAAFFVNGKKLFHSSKKCGC